MLLPLWKDSSLGMDCQSHCPKQPDCDSHQHLLVPELLNWTPHFQFHLRCWHWLKLNLNQAKNSLDEGVMSQLLDPQLHHCSPKMPQCLLILPETVEVHEIWMKNNNHCLHALGVHTHEYCSKHCTGCENWSAGKRLSVLVRYLEPLDSSKVHCLEHLDFAGRFSVNSKEWQSVSNRHWNTVSTLR